MWLCMHNSLIAVAQNRTDRKLEIVAKAFSLFFGKNIGHQNSEEIMTQQPATTGAA